MFCVNCHAPMATGVYAYGRIFCDQLCRDDYFGDSKHQHGQHVKVMVDHEKRSWTGGVRYLRLHLSDLVVAQ